MYANTGIATDHADEPRPCQRLFVIDPAPDSQNAVGPRAHVSASQRAIAVGGVPVVQIIRAGQPRGIAADGKEAQRMPTLAASRATPGVAGLVCLVRQRRVCRLT